MDSARCRCLTVYESETEGPQLRIDPGCPIHGTSAPDPIRPWALTWTDRKFLKSLRVDTEDSTAIQDVRRADERRFKRPE